MMTPLTLTRPARIHCLARLFGVSGCFRSNQSNRGLTLIVSIESKPQMQRHFLCAPRREPLRLCTAIRQNQCEPQGFFVAHFFSSTRSRHESYRQATCNLLSHMRQKVVINLVAALPRCAFASNLNRIVPAQSGCFTRPRTR